MRADELERRLAQLLAVERDRHVVQLGRLEQAVDVRLVAEDRRADLRVVAADALEHARAVVQAVREYVDLRVLPGDELPVQPDEVRLLHVRAPSSSLSPTGARALLGWPRPCSRCRRGRGSAARPARAASTADSTAAASVSKDRPWRSSRAVLRNIASGLAPRCPRCPARSRARARRRRGRRRRPRLALGSIPIEPVIIAASSLRMSPNMFSVTITSKSRGVGDELHRGVVDEHVLERDVGTPSAARGDRRAPQAAVSRTLALSTLVTLRARGAERDLARCASISCGGVGAEVRRAVVACASSRRSRCRP